MSLAIFLKYFKYVQKVNTFTVSHISSHSQDIQSNSCFLAIEGLKEDGHDYLDEVCKKDISGVIVKHASKVPSFFKGAVFTYSDMDFLTPFLKDFYDSPTEKMFVIGVTGTNGKTTIACLIQHLLDNCGWSTGVIGTLYQKIKQTSWPSRLTTPSPVELFSRSYDFLQKEARAMVMEVSSIGLDQNRVNGVDFNLCIFTNLTRDHLEYHKNFENYFLSKKKLFQLMEKGKSRNFVSLVNLDDPYGVRLTKGLRSKYYTYGSEHADFCFEILEENLFFTRFLLTTPEVTKEVKIPLIGRYNVSNATASLAASSLAGFPLEKAIEALSRFPGVPGRLERVSKDKNGIQIFLDYAHTPEALSQTLKALQKLRKKHQKIHTVFGCGGDRDKSKRGPMSKAAFELSERVTLTSDNPRSESPEKIAEACLKGLPEKHHVIVELDRKKAIEQTLKQADKGDIILIAGKGHEEFQIIGDKRLPFSDKNIVKNLLSRRV